MRARLGVAFCLCGPPACVQPCSRPAKDASVMRHGICRALWPGPMSCDNPQHMLTLRPAFNLLFFGARLYALAATPLPARRSNMTPIGTFRGFLRRNKSGSSIALPLSSRFVAIVSALSPKAVSSRAAVLPLNLKARRLDWPEGIRALRLIARCLRASPVPTALAVHVGLPPRLPRPNTPGDSPGLPAKARNGRNPQRRSARNVAR